ncbi:MAG TPA: DoxX family protein [Polyangiaceae bacterium]|jgi:hypothetical protein
MKDVSPRRRWSGIALSSIAVAFLLFDGVSKLAHVIPVVEATRQLGYPESSISSIGVLLLVGTALYALPRTARLGALFLTGFLGGAVAAQLRVGNPLFSHVLFPTYMAALIWLGLLLRDPRAVELLVRRGQKS